MLENGTKYMSQLPTACFVQNPENVQFTLIVNREKEQILTSQKL